MRRLALIACAFAGGAGLLVAGSASSDDGGPYEVRAIFDNAAFLVPGEEVRIAGAKVGAVDDVEVTRPGEAVTASGEDEPGKAAVVLRIDDPGFQDFREDASCIVRPQSTLGEKFVECEATQPRAPDTQPPPPLGQVPEGQPGEGQLLLPLENNGKAVDIDLVQNIMREPYADRFRLILNDLGAGLAARGDELEEIVKRSNPALRETNQVLAILRQQNWALAQLARDSDTVLEPLARERRSITGFIRNSTVPAQATAERAGDLEEGLRLFPGYLRELRKTSVELRKFSDAGTPVITAFGNAAPAQTRAQEALVPLAQAGIPALKTLGDAAEESQGDIVASDPVIKDVRDLAVSAKPGAKQLNELLRSLSDTDGFRDLMDFIFNTSAAVNGFDQYGHYLRTFALVTNCTQIIAFPVGGCSAMFEEEEPTTSASASTPSQLGSRGDQRPPKPRRRAGSLQRPREQAEPSPTPAQPDLQAPPDRAGDTRSEVAPVTGAGSTRGSTRAGRALLRFLMEDGR
jgi:phospholipid/cholesterol/gamma-HCH transport system substrate-binding protein